MKARTHHPIQYVILLSASLTLTFASSGIHAAEISGKVTEASGNAATIVTDGLASPAVGDKVDIFFKIAGVDEEISVATGKVTAVQDKTVQAALENATGTVGKDQLARITTATGRTSSSAAPLAVSDKAVVGDWVGKAPDGSSISFSFKGDGSLLWVVEEGEFGGNFAGKYRVDPSTQPKTIELFDLDDAARGETLRGVYELQNDGRLKADLSVGQQGKNEFTSAALIFSKATTPVVRSTKPTPPPYSLPATTEKTEPSAPPPAGPPEISKEDQALLDQGIAYKDLGELDRAVQIFTDAIARNPKNTDAYFWRGSCYDLQDKHEAAIRDWKQVIALDPSQKEKREALMKDLRWPEKAEAERAKRR